MKYRKAKKIEDSKPHKCKYCENPATYITPSGIYICESSKNQCPSIKKKNSDAIKKAHKDGRMPNNTFEGKRGWSKNLTKETDERVRRNAEAVKLSMNTNQENLIGRKHTKSTKLKISKSRTNYLENNPNNGIKGYSVNNGEKIIKVQGDWELKVANGLNENNIKGDRRRLKYYNTRQYTPDFYLTDYDIYLEVKGGMRERDKYKMFLVLDDNPNIEIKMIFKENINNIDNMSIDDLELFQEVYNRQDIDMSKFKNTGK